MSVLATQRYALGRAFAMVRDRPAAFVLGAVLTASALALPLALASIVWAARPALTHLRPAPEVSVFVSPRATARDVETLKGRLSALPGVTGVTVRPKDAALAQLIKRSGFDSLPAELAGNPLPDVLIAQLALPVPPDRVESIGAAVRNWPLVDAVRSDLDWYRKLRALGRLGLTVTAVFGGVVVLLIALILVGTVRLHAGTRAEEVAVLKLVGATPRFIVRPYAYSAILTLVVAAGLAVAFVYAAHAAVRAPLLDLSALYGQVFTLPDPEPYQVGAVFIAAVLIGWVVGVVGARGAIGGRA